MAIDLPFEQDLVEYAVILEPPLSPRMASCSSQTFPARDKPG